MSHPRTTGSPSNSGGALWDLVRKAVCSDGEETRGTCYIVQSYIRQNNVFIKGEIPFSKIL